MPDENTQGQQGNKGDQGKEGETPTYDAWIAGQDETVKGLVAKHLEETTTTLHTALKSEREARGQAEKKLREAAKGAEAGSALQKQLEAQADEMKEMNRQAGFYDQAHGAGVTNLRLAYLAAKEFGLVRDDGSFDVEGLKVKVPELFRLVGTAGKGNAGSGTDGKGTPAGNGDMNTLIRTGAGYAR